MSSPLPLARLLVFASPAAPIAGLGLPLVVYLPPFYAEDMGVGLSAVGMVFMITRFWDVAIDPVIGVVSDSWSTRFGRRRHWLVLAIPIVLLSAYYVFLPRPPVSAAYLLGWLIVLYAGWTLLAISHMSWGAELSSDYDERTRIQGWREIFLILGMVAVLALPAFIERTNPDSTAAERVAAMGWFIILFLPLTVFLAVTSVSEHDTPPAPHLGWRAAIDALAGNRPLRLLLWMDALGGIAGGVVSALFLFLAADRLGLEGWASALLLLYFLAGATFVTPVVRLSYRLGKHRALAASALFNAAVLPLTFLVPHGNVTVALFLFILMGVNMGAGPFLFRAIMADVADHDRATSGAQRTGLFFALLMMTNKIGYALSIGIVYPLLDWIGYQPGGTNSESSIAGLTAIYVWPAVASSLVIAVKMWSFPLDREKQLELQRTIESKERASREPEPAQSSG